MNRRPWPLVILAILHWIEPITKTLLNSVIEGVSPLQLISSLVTSATPLQLISYFLLFPMAGFCIYWMRLWSFIIFLCIHASVIISHLILNENYIALGNWALVFGLIVMDIMNVLIVAYFFSPVIFKTITDPKMRWWETAPRYLIDVMCQLHVKKNGTTLDAKIINLSEGGALLELSVGGLRKEDDITFSLPFFQHHFNLTAKVVHIQVNGPIYIGIAFEFSSKHEKKQIKAFTHLLDTLKFSTDNKRASVGTFTEWLEHFLKTGEGFTPPNIKRPKNE